MNNYVFTASDRQKYLIISDSEINAKIKFSQNLPSLKIKHIYITSENMFNIVE